MNVRRRLIFGFVGLAVFVLVLFGFVAHRAALELGQAEKIELIHDIAVAYAAGVRATNAAVDGKKFHLPDNPERNHLLLLVSTQGDVQSNFPIAEFLGGAQNDAYFSSLTSDGADRGKTIINKVNYLWAVVSVSPSQKLFLFNNVKNTLNSQSWTLASRLIVMAMLIIWMSVWIALILSKRIMRRLDTQNEALIHQATYDELTDLPNRRHLFDHLHQRITSGQNPSPFSLLVMDLNRFKEVNDTLGHHVGDELIIQMARRLRQALPDAPLIARLGGDEFAIVLAQPEHLALHSAIINGALGIPFNLNLLDIAMDVGIGAAIYPAHAQDASTLIKHAEIAMYHAKQEQIPFLVYNPDNDPHSLRRLTLMADLRHSIEKNQLRLMFQPKVDLPGLSTSGAEALIRWQHPEFGMIPPDEFIGMAEHSDFINEMTVWVLREALGQCQRWHAMGLKLGVAVNLSVRSLQNVRLPQLISDLLIEFAVAPEYLKLEITESAIMADPQRALQTLHQLSAQKLSLSIDDFGTGYSSLSYLKKLPVNELKIDKSFVMEMLVNENDRVIVHSTIELAHNLGYKVVAEGIEDEDTLLALRGLGCDLGQGYYMSRPITAEAFTEWLGHCQWPAITE